MIANCFVSVTIVELTVPEHPESGTLDPALDVIAGCKMPTRTRGRCRQLSAYFRLIHVRLPEHIRR
jgi:hypothetical protein